MMVSIRLIMVSIIMSSAIACTDMISIDFGLTTTHLISPDEWNLNEDNNFTGVSYKCFFYGNFVNSYNNESHIVGYSFDINKYWNINVGVIHGYNKYNLIDFMFIPKTELVWVVAPELTLPITDHISITGRLFGEVLQTGFKVSF